jgi:hypothetical protein
MSDERVILTPDQAIGLLHDEGEYVHNFTMGQIMIGVDYSRDAAIKAFREAHQIELGGPGTMRMRHPLVVWDTPRHCTAFEADMSKVEAFEAALTKSQQSVSEPGA